MIYALSIAALGFIAGWILLSASKTSRPESDEERDETDLICGVYDQDVLDEDELDLELYEE